MTPCPHCGSTRTIAIADMASSMSIAPREKFGDAHICRDCSETFTPPARPATHHCHRCPYAEAAE